MTDITAAYIDHMGTDLSVVNAARVSFEKASSYLLCSSLDLTIRKDLDHKDKKLIQYLARHDHKSPFNHTFTSFRCKAPVFVARQLVKHEYMPWNEVSRRYVHSEPEFYQPDTWRKKSDDVKQGSSDEAVDHNGLPFFSKFAEQTAIVTYKRMLEIGVCPEQARMVLPQSMMTEWIWSGTVFAIAKMYNLRIDPHTQYETRIVAKLIGDKMAELYPVSWEALTNGT